MTHIVMYRCTVFVAYHSVLGCSTIQAVGFVIAGPDHIKLSRKQQIGVTPSSDLFHQSDFALRDESVWFLFTVIQTQ